MCMIAVRRQILISHSGKFYEFALKCHERGTDVMGLTVSYMLADLSWRMLVDLLERDYFGASLIGAVDGV